MVHILVGNMKLQLDEDGNILDRHQDYILFLGTSHTMGECMRENSAYLKEEEVWVNLLSDKLGLPYIKLAFGGAENWHITQMLNSFITNHHDFKDRCKMVIGELRLGSYEPITSWDALDGNVGGIRLYDKHRPAFKSSRGLNDIEPRPTHILANNCTLTSQEEVDRQSESFWRNNPDAKIGLQSMFESFIINHGTSINYQKSFYEVINMEHIVRCYNVPFKWFSWLDFERNISGKEEFINWYKYVSESMRLEYPHVWDKNILKEEMDIGGLFGIRDYSDSSITTCECLHMDERYQEPIATALYEKINKHEQ